MSTLHEDFELLRANHVQIYSFIKELSHGLKGKICAYSLLDNEEGCLIYLQNLDQRIFVHADVIEHQRRAAIRVLQDKIRDGMEGESALVLKQVGNGLVFEEEAKASHQVSGAYPTLKSVR